MAASNLHENHRARMQARVERDGLESLAEHEALEYLLYLSIPRMDTNELAHRLIEHFGDFCKVMEAEPEELAQVDGIGPKSAHLIVTVMAYSRYYTLKKRVTRQSLRKAESAIEYVKPLFCGIQNEQLYLILLDDACRPMQDLRIAEGVPNRVTVDTRKLLRAVARTNSTCGILAHNHPSGLALPSEADRLTTALWRSQVSLALRSSTILLWRGRMPARCSCAAACRNTVRTAALCKPQADNALIIKA